MSHHSHLSDEVDETVRAVIRRHKRGLRWGLAVALLLTVGVGAVAAWALFRGAVRVKDWVAGKTPEIRMPLEWEKVLGEAALAEVRSQARFITDPRVIDPLQRLAAPLFSARTNSGDRFAVFVTDSKDINALALPGGFIVFHRGLLERARSPEEVQGVLAHEMAHVIKCHSVLQLAQNMGLDLLVQQLQGNESRLRDALIRDSGQLLGLKFSRDHERAADDLAWELLEQASVNPQGMVDFFAAMKAEQDAKGPGGFSLGANLLSTHPTPLERIDRLKQRQTRMSRSEFRSYETDFQVLREALKPMLERP